MSDQEPDGIADGEIAHQDPPVKTLRDHVSKNAIIGPDFIDDMATTGRFFAWPADEPVVES